MVHFCALFMLFSTVNWHNNNNTKHSLKVRSPAVRGPGLLAHCPISNWRTEKQLSSL